MCASSRSAESMPLAWLGFASTAARTRKMPTVRKTTPRATPPAWPNHVTTRRIVGVVVILLSLRLLVVPLPFSNVLPALLIALISLAYLEEDGLALSISLLAGAAVLAADLGLLWQMKAWGTSG